MSKKDSASSALDKAAEKLKSAGGIEIISASLHGKPEQALCEYEDNRDIDLTIMGALSHTRIHDLILGSFTVKMLLNTKTPLLLLR